MSRLGKVLVGGAAASAMGIGALFLGGLGYSEQASQACDKHPVYLNPATATIGSSTKFNKPEQIAIARTIKGIGISRQLKSADVMIALFVGMTESGLRNLPYGDRDSLGIFQQRPGVTYSDGSPYWGTKEQIMNPVYSINRFYDELEKQKNRESRPIVDVAYDVQRPASKAGYEAKYREFEGEILRLIGNTNELVKPVSAPSVTLPTELCSLLGATTGEENNLSVIIQAALSRQGQPYSFGQSTRLTFDDGEFMQWAYKQGGVNLPPTAAAQLKFGAVVSPNSSLTGNAKWESVIKPGDLVFWTSKSGLVTRVALHVGGNKVIGAAALGEKISLKPIAWTSATENVTAITRPQLPGGFTGITGGWAKPVSQLQVTSCYGNRWHPTQHRWMLHEGVDFKAAINTPVYAAHDGVVIKPYGHGYGVMLHIDHGSGVETSYSHLTRYADGITIGSKVKAKQLVAYSGNTGWSTGPHVHFVVLKDNVPVPPLNFLRQFGIIPINNMCDASKS